MTYTHEQLSRLKDAFASGVLEVVVNNEKTVYKSNAEMREAIRVIEKELGMRRKTRMKALSPTYGKGL